MHTRNFSSLLGRLATSSASSRCSLLQATSIESCYSFTEPWTNNKLYAKRTLACTSSSAYSTWSKHHRLTLASGLELPHPHRCLPHSKRQTSARDFHHCRQYALHHRLPNSLCNTHICQGDDMNDLGCHRTRRSMSVMSYAVNAAPRKVQPYLRLMRVDKPIGTWLCYWPCAWSIGLAADPGHFPSLYLLGLCGVGALVVRGAGCTINDMWDRDFDKSVERTQSRPIASGEISRKQALFFLAAELSVALGILFTLNTYSIALGFVAMVPIAVYPLMKRFTYWPQIFLGLTINFGALIGYAAVHGSCDWSVVAPLYASCIAWTMVYDTIYGHQDKRDDLALGLGSTAILMGENTKYWLTGFGAVMVSGLTVTGILAEQTLAYYLAVALTAGHIGNQVWNVDIHNPEDCWNKFRSNHRLGAIIFAGIVAGTLAKASSKTKDRSTKVDETSPNDS